MYEYDVRISTEVQLSHTRTYVRTTYVINNTSAYCLVARLQRDHRGLLVLRTFSICPMQLSNVSRKPIRSKRIYYRNRDSINRRCPTVCDNLSTLNRQTRRIIISTRTILDFLDIHPANANESTIKRMNNKKNLMYVHTYIHNS